MLENPQVRECFLKVCALIDNVSYFVIMLRKQQTHKITIVQN